MLSNPLNRCAVSRVNRAEHVEPYLNSRHCSSWRGGWQRFSPVLLLCLLCCAMMAPRRGEAGPKSRLLGKLAAVGVAALAAKLGTDASAAPDVREAEPDPFKQCIHDLMAVSQAKDPPQSAVGELLGSLQGMFRLPQADAEDIAYAVLVDICMRHSTSPYSSLGGAYYRAGANRALKFYRRYQLRYLSCDRIEDLAIACPTNRRWPPPDANARLNAEVDIARRAVCSLTTREQQVLYARAVDEKSFAEVGKITGMTTGQAHDTYHNALRRVQAQVGCPGD